VGFELPDPSRATDGDDEPLLPGDEDAPEFAQDFVAED
jgi:segregation and condensation protein B